MLDNNEVKILHVVNSLKIGGAEHFVVDLLIQLKAIGKDVSLLVLNGQQSFFYELLEKEGISVYILSMSSFIYNPCLIVKMLPLFRQFDIIHSHLTASQLFVAVCSLFYKKKIYTTEHSTDNRRRHLWWCKMIDKWMYSRYNKVICISALAAYKLNEYLGNVHNIICINNGIDISKFNSASPNKSFLNSKQDKFAITMVARMEYPKDHETLIRSMILLPDNVILWFVGNGMLQDSLKQLADTLGVNNRIVFWGIQNDVAGILKASDIIVMSSHYEGLSLSSIEGMASGKPFVASDVPGLHEVTEGAGLLFEHRNERDLANQIKKLIDNEIYYKSISQRCVSRAKQFDISSMITAYCNVYKG